MWNLVPNTRRPMSDAIPPKVDARYAWRELPRRDPPKRSAAERMADFLEIYGLYDEVTAREQASRCIQCPEPVCISGCPLGSRIPEWLALTAEGQFLEAAAVLHSTSNLPEVCASSCPADRLCEGMCILEGRAEPVSAIPSPPTGSMVSPTMTFCCCRQCCPRRPSP